MQPNHQQTSADASSITYAKGATTFDGPDGVAFFRATVLASAMSLYAKTGMKASQSNRSRLMRHLPQDLTRQPDEDGPRWLLWTLDAFAGGILVLLCILAFFFMGLLSDKTDGGRHAPIIHVQRLSNGVSITADSNH